MKEINLHTEASVKLSNHLLTSSEAEFKEGSDGQGFEGFSPLFTPFGEGVPGMQSLESDKKILGSQSVDLTLLDTISGGVEGDSAALLRSCEGSRLPAPGVHQLQLRPLRKWLAGVH